MQLNNWFTLFLFDRTFYDKANNVKSDEFNMNIGTPQGSVLGSLIFVLFDNKGIDIAKNSNFRL